VVISLTKKNSINTYIISEKQHKYTAAKSKTTHSTPENLQVLFEDNHIIVVNKRPGDIVQGDKTGDIPLSEITKQYLAKKYNKPGAVFLGVVHRLDRPTSGVIVFARTSKALPRLNTSFAERETEKTYWAVVKNHPPKEHDSLTHFLKRNPKQNKSYAHTKEVPESKKAILHYRILKKMDRYIALEIQLETGRHHQIRAQLASINCPIKGDLKYGFDRSNKDGSIHLHARKLSFIHPVKKEEMTVIAPPPQDVLWINCTS
jgi:23S rRNA pseudouridine1911/1915/1917 synthase